MQTSPLSPRVLNALNWLFFALCLLFMHTAVLAQTAVPDTSLSESNTVQQHTINFPENLLGALEEPATQSKNTTQSTGQGSGAIRILVGLTLLAILPALLVCMTSFLRIVMVLSMLRYAIGMPQTPPNIVIIGISLFLTLFSMAPVLEKMNNNAMTPYLQQEINLQQAYQRASEPMREFMLKNVNEKDLNLMLEVSGSSASQPSEVSNTTLIPAFMLSELRTAFKIGFLVFIPFLLIDLVVASILMALGMMMMPPTTVSLPIKVLMFVLVDGWTLLVKALMGSFL